jgi:hypothetical protein
MPIKILNGYNKTHLIIENYMNDFSIKKNKEMDFIKINEYMYSIKTDFDWEIYLLLNPDLAKFGIKTSQEAFNHWQSRGKFEGRKYSEINFDWEMYILLHDDLKLAGIDTKLASYSHWINYGKNEKRMTFDPNFDWDDYLLLYPDLKKNGISTEVAAYKHWINFGKTEGRTCKIDWENIKDFDWEFYLESNVDLKQNGIMSKAKLYSHWLNHGKFEKRISSVKIYEKIYKVVEYKDYNTTSWYKKIN